MKTRSERGEELRHLRQRLGLSAYRAAILADIHPNSLLLAERGACSEQMLERIAKALAASEPRP
jgi:hypothetical protein